MEESGMKGMYERKWTGLNGGYKLYQDFYLYARPPLDIVTGVDGSAVKLDDGQVRALERRNDELGRRFGFLMKEIRSSDLIRLREGIKYYDHYDDDKTAGKIVITAKGSELAYRRMCERYESILDEWRREAQEDIERLRKEDEDAVAGPDIMDDEWDDDENAKYLIEEEKDSCKRRMDAITRDFEDEEELRRDATRQAFNEIEHEFRKEAERLEGLYEGDYKADSMRMARIARLITSTFHKYKRHPRPWGQNGVIYPDSDIIVFKSRGKWCLFSFVENWDDEKEQTMMIDSLKNHRFNFDESLVRYYYRPIKNMYMEFMDIDMLREYMMNSYGISFEGTMTGARKIEGIDVYNLINESEFTMDDAARIIRSVKRSIEKHIGRGKMDRYMPGKVFFEHEYTDGIAGQNNRDNGSGPDSICVDPHQNLQANIETFIHEISHNIMKMNPEVKRLITEKFNDYHRKNGRFTSFKKGDIVMIKNFKRPVEFLDDYDPVELSKNGGYVVPTNVMVRNVTVDRDGDVVSTGSPYSFDKIKGSEIQSVIKCSEAHPGADSIMTDGYLNDSEGIPLKNEKNNLGTWSYAFVNPEEFISVLLSKYCLGWLPVKMERFVKDSVIPAL